jgi:LDH2 family malate/lactate/ureidoglycolate dehydrogenase
MKEGEMAELFYVVPVEEHERVVCAAYANRGFTSTESKQAARLATAATKHGIRTHNAIKAIHLDDLFGSSVGGCVPGVSVQRLDTRFDAAEVWDGKKSLDRLLPGKQSNAVLSLQKYMARARYRSTTHFTICGAVVTSWRLQSVATSL